MLFIRNSSLASLYFWRGKASATPSNLLASFLNFVKIFTRILIKKGLKEPFVRGENLFLELLKFYMLMLFFFFFRTV